MSRRARGFAVFAAALGVLFVGACTGGSTQPPAGKTASTSPSSHRVTRPTGAASTSLPAAESALRCGDYIDTHAPTAPLRVVLGVVALPVSPAYPALGTALTGDGNGPTRLFAKTGLLIKAGRTFELDVPAEFSDRLSIGWGGAPSTPSHRVTVSPCADRGGAGWLAYAGGYWVAHPACVPLIVKAGSTKQQVHIGIGTACPGQRPPQGPTQS